MFNQNTDDRLSSWAQHRAQLSISDTPFMDVWEFWRHAPYIHYNNKVDPYHQRSWPSPWEIIVDNHYDDFTKSLMIAWTLKLSTAFQQSKIEIKTLVDKAKSRQYNIVYVDETWAINYNDEGPVLVSSISDTLLLENIIDISMSR